MKRFVATLLSIILILSSVGLFTGCSSSKDVIVLTIYNENIDEPGYLSGWFADLVRDKFNIQIQYLSVNDTGFSAYVEQKDLGDLIIFSSTKHYRMARDGGALLDWNTSDFLTTYAPTLQKEQALSLQKNQKENGSNAIYGIYANVSLNDDIYTQPACVYLNTQYYEALQSPSVPNFDALKDVVSQMVALAKNDMTTVYGFSSSNANDDVMLSFLADSVALYGYEAFGLGVYNPATNDYQDCLDTDGIYYKTLLKFRDWYQEGLVDTSSSTQTNSELSKKYEKGQVMMSFHAQDGFTPICIGDATPNRYQQDPAGSGSIISIASNSKYPDYALQLIEWLYSAEGYLSTNYGPQGVSWDYDADGNPYITELGEKILADSTINLSDYDCGYSGRVGDGLSHLNTNTWDARSSFPGNHAITFDCTTWSGQSSAQSNPLENFPYNAIPATTFSMAEISAEERIPYTQIAAVVNSYSWFIIYSKTDSDVESYTNGMISLAKAYRYDLPEAFYQEQLQQYQQSLGY